MFLAMIPTVVSFVCFDLWSKLNLWVGRGMACLDFEFGSFQNKCNMLAKIVLDTG